MKKHNNTPKPSNHDLDLVRTLADQDESANRDRFDDDRVVDHGDHEGAAIEKAERLAGC
ncbi:MAG: hypothetical protein ACRC2U_20830 [Aeromonas sp.]